jgi:hypothetical protein
MPFAKGRIGYAMSRSVGFCFAVWSSSLVRGHLYVAATTLSRWFTGICGARGVLVAGRCGGEIPGGVMVTHQVLVLVFLVRIQAG